MASPQAPAQYDEKGKQTAACELVPVNSLIIIMESSYFFGGGGGE